MPKKEKIVWIVFYFLVLLIFSDIASGSFGFNSELAERASDLLFFGTPVFLSILHSLFFLSSLRTLFFMGLAYLTGWMLEVYGLIGGTFFGGYYVYNMGQAAILDVPLLVILYWTVFIYTGYSITNSFIYWLSKRKPSRDLKNFWLLPALILFDGWIVVAIDLFMDPLQVKSGSWAWLDGGPYFGVPIGNFVGWFLVTIIVTGIFRIFEYYSPTKEMKNNKSVYLTPVLGYGFLAIYFMIDAIRYQMFSLAFIGSTLMLSIVVFNITLFFKWRRVSLDLS